MELRAVPHINEPGLRSALGVCQELGVPLAFMPARRPKIQMRPGDGFTPAVAAAFSSVVRSVSSVAVLANFLISRVLHRFPKLKVVFAESSLGWGAYEIEYADYQSDADGLPSEGYPLKPSELFQRQCYFTCWYDRMSLRRAALSGHRRIYYGRAIFRWRLRLGPIRGSSSQLALPSCPKLKSGRSNGKMRLNFTRCKSKSK